MKTHIRDLYQFSIKRNDGTKVIVQFDDVVGTTTEQLLDLFIDFCEAAGFQAGSIDKTLSRYVRGPDEDVVEDTEEDSE